MTPIKKESWLEMNWEVVAETFHDNYEELAPLYGYETREDTKAFDPKSPNGRLMIEVVKGIGKAIMFEAHRKAYAQALLDLESKLPEERERPSRELLQDEHGEGAYALGQYKGHNTCLGEVKNIISQLKK